MKIFDDDDDYDEYDDYDDFEYGEDDDYEGEEYDEEDDDDDDVVEPNKFDVTPLEVSTPSTTTDFSELVIKDLHIVLTTHKNPWPEKYTKREKIVFLDKVLEYLQDRQLYEMCSDIQKVKNEVVNESGS